MNREANDELASRMPIVAHESVTGVDCCGCIIRGRGGQQRRTAMQ
jgi:hypothetical protein